jgi:hypothetical protein
MNLNDFTLHYLRLFIVIIKFLTIFGYFTLGNFWLFKVTLIILTYFTLGYFWLFKVTLIILTYFTPGYFLLF